MAPAGPHHGVAVTGRYAGVRRPPPHGKTPARGYLRVGGEMRDFGDPRRPLGGAVLPRTVLPRRVEPAAALEARHELRILQAPQQLGHGEPRPRLLLRPAATRVRVLGVRPGLAFRSRVLRAPGERAGRSASQQVRRPGPSARPALGKLRCPPLPGTRRGPLPRHLDGPSPPPLPPPTPTPVSPRAVSQLL